MKFNLLIIIALLCLSVSCKNDKPSVKTESPKPTVTKQAPKLKNKAHQLVYDMVKKVGDYNKLMNLKDVVYTYTYQTPDGKTDISTEKYIFNGELSYGAYNKHERTFSQLNGLIEQGYDGTEYWLKHNGEIISDKALLKRVAFNRPTNFYWFAMMPKLLDQNLNYEYLQEQHINGNTYDVVKVTFKSVYNKPKDIYQLYINKNTHLVDQFLFTVAEFGKTDPLLMTIEYENIEGMLIPTKRQYKKSNWDAEVRDAPWTKVTWSNIKFNNNLQAGDFKKN